MKEVLEEGKVGTVLVFLFSFPLWKRRDRAGLNFQGTGAGGGREGGRQRITAKHWISLSEGFKPQRCLRWKNSCCSQSHACIRFLT